MLSMRIDGNTVLMTGGSSGIGLALAERFVKLGNIVIICGRREERLKEKIGMRLQPGLRRTGSACLRISNWTACSRI